MKWININKQLPDPEFDWVLVCADSAMATMAYSSKNGFYEAYGNACGNIIIEDITHWQPMPDVPKDT